MVERIKKPSTPSNYVIYEVDHHTNLSQQTEERWLHSVIINSRLVFNGKSLSILTVVRSPVTRVFCSCASSMRNSHSHKNSTGFSTTGDAIGIASNSVFNKRTERWVNKAKRKYARTKIPIRLLYSFRHRARSWNKRRRIVVKIEVGPLGTNVRFIITNRSGRAEAIYDGYDQRGECENRIKEFKRDLSAD